MQISKVLLLTLAATFIAAAQQDPPGRVGRLGYMTGSVSFQPAGVDDWVPANPNRPLITGDHLWVDQNARAELHIGGTGVRLNSGTAFEFLNLDDQAVQIRLTQGSIDVHVRFLDDNQTFEVDTPNVAISFLRPGVYRVDANPDQQLTLATVRSGQAEGTGGGQAFEIRPHEQAQITGDQQISLNIVAAARPDWFDSWADERDRREEVSQSARYCSRDMIGYQDLDDSGDWRDGGEYGQVWYPRAVPVGWAPYRYGHWAWIEPWGWTWVDDESWGFAPFHYGRWAVIGGAWGWVPGPIGVRPVYAPALVAFVGGSGFSVGIGVGGGVAWFPLGPHEVYVPAYRSSLAYVNRVNVTNTVVNNTTIVNVYNNTNVTNVRYVNQTAPGAVTAVTRETFVNARPVHQAVIAVQPQQLARATVVRTAPVVPTQAAVLGRATTVSAPRPPAAVFTRTVVTKATPPPPPVAFTQRQQLLQQNPGQPLAPQQVQQIRTQSPPPARPAFRPAPPARAVATPPPANQVPANPPPGQQPYRNPNVNQPRPTYQTPPPSQVSPQTRPVEPSQPANQIRQPRPQQDQPPRPVTPQQEQERVVRPNQAPPPAPRQYEPPPQRQYDRPAERPAAPPPAVQRQYERPAPPARQVERQPPPPQEKPKQEKKEEKKPEQHR